MDGKTLFVRGIPRALHTGFHAQCVRAEVSMGDAVTALLRLFAADPAAVAPYIEAVRDEKEKHRERERERRWAAEEPLS